MDDTFRAKFLENLSNPFRSRGDSLLPTHFAKLAFSPFTGSNQGAGQSIRRILDFLHHETPGTSFHKGSCQRIVCYFDEDSIAKVGNKGASSPTVFVTAHWYGF
jgi:hypothetical protein